MAKKSDERVPPRCHRLFRSDLMSVCLSALGSSSPLCKQSSVPIVQACLNRATEASANRSKAKVNGRAPSSRPRLPSKPQGRDDACADAAERGHMTPSGSRVKVQTCTDVLLGGLECAYRFNLKAKQIGEPGDQ